MSASTGAGPSRDDLTRTASEAVRAGVDIRAKIHDATLVALRHQRFDRHGLRDVIRAVTEGVALGAEGSRADLRQSLSEAFRGMDGAVTRMAESGRTALQQLVAAGRDLSDNDIKQALATMKQLEEDFLATAGRVADAASAKVQPELRRQLDIARETGTETGKVAAATFTNVAQRFSVASIDVSLAGLEVAGELGARFAQLASGILAGIADALAKPEPRSDKPPN